MRTVEWAVRAERVTVRLDKDDRDNMEAIRRAVLGDRQGMLLGLSYADTLRLALAYGANALAREAARVAGRAPSALVATEAAAVEGRV